MSAAIDDILIRKGFTFSSSYEFYEPSLICPNDADTTKPINFELDSTFTWQVRNKEGKTLYLFTQPNHVQVTNNQLMLFLPKENTSLLNVGQFYYDVIELTQSGNKEAIISGTLTITI